MNERSPRQFSLALPAWPRVLPRVGLVLLIGVISACSRSVDRTQLPSQIFVLGVDAFSPELVQELAGEGKLPHFARLLEEGAFAPLRAEDPLKPSQLWTTALTGKGPATHRVVGEYIVLPRDGTHARTPSSARTTQTVMQIVGSQGHTVASVGLPGTWPAEVVNGFVVANGYRPHRWTEASEHDFDLESVGLTTYPPYLADEIQDLVHGVDELPREDVARFFVFNEREFEMLYDSPLGSLHQRDNPPRDFALTLQADRTNLAVARRLAERYRPRLVITDLELPAAVEPTFWYFMEPDRYSTPRDSQRRLGHAVLEVYRWVDEQVGALLEILPSGSTLVVVAPSGFGDGSKLDPEGKEVPAPVLTAEGGIWMWGQGVVPGGRADAGNLADLTPTLLALLDLDVGGDMDGSVLRSLLDPLFVEAHPISTVESWDEDWDQEHRFPDVAKPRTDAADSSAAAPPTQETKP